MDTEEQHVTENTPRNSSNHPQRGNERRTIEWIVFQCMVVIVPFVIMAGNAYCINLPSALRDALEDSMPHRMPQGDEDDDDDDDDDNVDEETEFGNGFDSDKFNHHFALLTSLYHVPNTVLPLIGGALIVDRWGACVALILFTTLTLVGQSVLVIGTSLQSWWTVWIGRFVYALGGESVPVAVGAWLVENDLWLARANRIHLATSMALCLVVGPTVGEMANSIVTRWIMTHGRQYPIRIAMNVGLMLNALSVSLVLALQYSTEAGVVARRTTTTPSESQEMLRTDEPLREPLLLEQQPASDDNDSPEEQGEAVGTSVNETEMTIAVPRSEEEQEPPESVANGRGQENAPSPLIPTSVEEEDQLQPSCASLVSLGILFWLLCAVCLTAYGAIIGFQAVATPLFLQRYNFRPPPRDCTLLHSDQCTAGTFAPPDSNPSTDSKGEACPPTGFAPVLPSSLQLNHSAYTMNEVYDDLVDCTVSFWSNGCLSDFCTAKAKATRQAKRLGTLPGTLGALLSPLVGAFVDRYGQRAPLLAVSQYLLLFVHLTLPWMMAPRAAMVGLGMAYALVTGVLWASVPFVTRRCGTAFGCFASIQNVVRVITALLVVNVFPNGAPGAVAPVELMVTIMAVMGCLVGTLLHVVDGNTGHPLNGNKLIEYFPHGRGDGDDNDDENEGGNEPEEVGTHNNHEVEENSS